METPSNEEEKDSEVTIVGNNSSTNVETGDVPSHTVVQHPHQKSDHERTETAHQSFRNTTQLIPASNTASTKISESLTKNAETLDCVKDNDAHDNENSPNENSPTINEKTTKDKEASCVAGSPVKDVTPVESSGDAEKNSPDANQEQTPQKASAGNKPVQKTSTKKAANSETKEKHSIADEGLSDYGNDEFENLTLEQIIANSKENHTEAPGANVVVLNAIFGEDILSLNCRQLIIGVVTSVDHFQKFHPGRIVAYFDNCVWLRFYISLGHDAYVDYKYCAVQKLHYYLEPFWEVMHKTTSTVNRSLTSFDFDKVEKNKYDGHIKFGNESKTWLEGAKKKFKSMFPGSKKSDLDYYLLQNMQAFEYYAKSIIGDFTKRLDVDWLLRNWRCLFKTVCFVQWKENYRKHKESFDIKTFLESSLKSFYSMYEQMKPPVGEPECFEAVTFKLCVVLFVSSDRRFIEELESEQWEKLQKWLLLRGKESKSRFLKEVKSQINEDSSFFSAIRESCQRILTIGSQHKMKSSSHFYVFFEWAFLDDGECWLEVPPSLRLTEDSYESLKLVHTSPATNRHILMLSALSKTTEKLVFNDKNWLTSDILSCLIEIWTSRSELPEVFSSFLKNVPLSPNSSPNEIQKSFKLVSQFIQSVLEKRSFFYKNYIYFLNVFIHCSLDILAIVDIKANEELLQMKSNFYKIIEELIVEINCRDFYSFRTIELFYWANLLQHRCGYSQESVEFIDNRIRKKFLNFVNLNSVARNLIPTLCVELPEKMESLKKEGYAIDCFENLNSTFEEAFIETMFSWVNSSCSDVDLILKIDQRPKVTEAFCTAILEKFPEVSENEPSTVIVEKVLEYPSISIILDLLDKGNQVVRNHFGGRVKLIRKTVVDVVGLVERADVNAKQVQMLWKTRNKFAELSQKLGVFDPNSVNIAFTRIDAVYKTVSKEIKNLSKLLELTNKFKSSGIKINTSHFELLHKEWESYPFNKLVNLKPQSLEFSIVPELPTFDDVRAVELYADLMTSVIFTNYATEMIKASFEKSEEPAFTYRHFLTVEMKRVHRYYLQRADAVAKGDLTMSEAKALFKRCANDSMKSKEMEFFFKFLKREISRPEVVAELDRMLETRKKQLKEIDSLGKSVAFMRALRNLVDLLKLTNLDNNFNQLKRLENFDSFRVCELTDELLSCNEEFSDVKEMEIKAIDAFVEQPAFLSWIREKMKNLSFKSLWIIRTLRRLQF